MLDVAVYPLIYHVCGWVSQPGEVIPGDSPRTGPWYCPQCGGHLQTIYLPKVYRAPHG